MITQRLSKGTASKALEAGCSTARGTGKVSLAPARRLSPGPGEAITRSRPASSLRARILHRLTIPIALALVGFLWLTGLAQAQTFKVGSFTKRTGAAPGSWVEVRE